MKMNVYAVFDKAVSAYMRPFFMQSDGQALRSFKDEALNADSPIGQHPEDYTLFRLASWDDNTGDFEVSESRRLARAHELAAADRAAFVNGETKDA